MERITFEGNFCDIAMCNGEYRMTTACADGPCSQRQVWERLKQYEDSGLTPEEVMLYAKAKAEGRIQVQPCQIGATVYELRSRSKNSTGRKYNISATGAPNYQRLLRSEQWEPYVAPKKCTKSDLNWMGRTVFLTEEEAEQALEEIINA